MAVIYLQPKPNFGAALGAGISQGFNSIAPKLALEDINRRAFVRGLEGEQTAADTRAATAGQPVDLTQPDQFSQLLALTKAGMNPGQAMDLQQAEQQRLQSAATIQQLRANTDATIKRSSREEALAPLELMLKEGAIDVMKAEKIVRGTEAKFAEQLTQARLGLLDAQTKASAANAAGDKARAAAELMRAEALQVKAATAAEGMRVQRKFLEKFMPGLTDQGGGAQPQSAPGGMPQAPGGSPASLLGMDEGDEDPMAPMLPEGGPQAPGLVTPAGGPPRSPLPVQKTQASGGAANIQDPTGLGLRPGQIMGIGASIAGLPPAVSTILAGHGKPDWDIRTLKTGPEQETTIRFDKNAEGKPRFDVISRADLRSTKAPPEIVRGQQGLVRMEALHDALTAVANEADKGNKVLGGVVVGQLNNMFQQVGLGVRLGDGELTKQYQAILKQMDITLDEYIKGVASNQDIDRYKGSRPGLEQEPQFRAKQLALGREMLNLQYKNLYDYFGDSSENKPLSAFEKRVKALGLDKEDVTVLQRNITNSLGAQPQGSGAASADPGRAQGQEIGGVFYSQQDLQYTAERHKISVDEVIKRLSGAKRSP